jgi:N-ethylmaleimide reductase
MSVETPTQQQKGAAPLSPSAEKLFEHIRLGPYQLRHRIVMAPLTRSRARAPGNIPTPLMAAYYAQRAPAAMIISEATQVSMQGQGYAWTPGIHSREQVEGWRLVTAAVHAAGGLIFLQLWHVGRISHPALQPDNMLPVGPSAIKADATAFIENEQGQGEVVPCVAPRALASEEMPYLVRQYQRGLRNAVEAGFDGVEIHGANGYLIEQFLCTGSNKRSDNYGGPIANRARLLMEVVEAACAEWGSERVGVRLSPLSTFNDIHDENPHLTYGHVAEKLNDYRLAYLHVINPAAAALEKKLAPPPEAMKMVDLIRNKYRGLMILCGGFDHDTAEEWLEQGKADLIAFGRKFIANPDLPERFRQRAELNPDDPATYYGGGPKGYTDYPTLVQLRGGAPTLATDQSWR